MLGEQVDKRREWSPLRCAPPYDLPAQRDTYKPPLCYGHTRKARNFRRVSPAACSFFSHVQQGLTLFTAKTAPRELHLHSIHYSIQMPQKREPFEEQGW